MIERSSGICKGSISMQRGNKCRDDDEDKDKREN